ncbi:Structural maintenance of chromosomes protein 4, partial [Marasmius crinis-equi]
ANEKTLKDLQAELEEVDEEVQELADYVAGLKTQVAEAQEKEENSKEDLEQYKAQLDEKQEEVQKFKAKEAKIQAKLDQANKKFQQNEVKINHWQEEHDKLRLEVIEHVCLSSSLLPYSCRHSDEYGDDDDDDEEEDDAESPEGGKEGEEREAEEKMDEDDSSVKPDPDAPPGSKKKAADDQDPTKPPELNEEELRKYKVRDLGVDIEYLEDKLKRAKPNLNVIDEYNQRMEEVPSRFNEVEKVKKQQEDMKKKHDDFRKQRFDEFMAGFSAISLGLRRCIRYFGMITMGGNAELELVDSMDPFSEGIIFSVMPPKKSWKNIANLPGGEKTLSSLALVFALHVFKVSPVPWDAGHSLMVGFHPTPLYFMDEIDAALDFRNVCIVTNYIKDRTKNAQFIIISLRNDMFEFSHRLIGIYKTANVTHSISIDNHALPQPTAQWAPVPS